MKNCLLLDGSFACIPIVRALSCNYNVFTCGNKKDAYFASNYASNHKLIDYSLPPKVEKIICENKIDLVVPGCTDLSLDAYGKVDLDFGMAIKKVSSKEAFHNFCLKLQLKSPKSFSTVEECYFPVIVKPDDAFSGKGVTVVEEKLDIHRAIDSAMANSNSKKIIIQEYLIGQLHSVSAFKQPDGSIFKFLVEEHCNQHRFSVDESFVLHAPPQWDEALDEIINRIYSEMPECVAFLHMQFIVCDNVIRPLELMLRCPGDLYSLLIQYSTGIDYGALYINSFGGTAKNKVDTLVSQNRHVKRLTLKVSPEEMVPNIQVPSNTIDFYRTIPAGYLNTGELPLRYAVIFLEVEELTHDTTKSLFEML